MHLLPCVVRRRKKSKTIIKTNKIYDSFLILLFVQVFLFRFLIFLIFLTCHKSQFEMAMNTKSPSIDRYILFHASSSIIFSHNNRARREKKLNKKKFVLIIFFFFFFDIWCERGLGFGYLFIRLKSTQGKL